jgi:hypothetical protein
MNVYIVTVGDQILADGGVFSDDHNVTAVYQTFNQAKDHLNQFIRDFYNKTSDPLKWLRNNYLPCSDIEKGLGVRFELFDPDHKIKHEIYCQYEEVEVTEVAEGDVPTSDNSGVA